MTGGALLIVLVTAWVATGLGVALWLRRRGHDLPIWSALGGLLGPLAVPIGRTTVAHEAPGPVAGSPRSSGDTPGLDLLVAVDGSQTALAAAAGALEVLGDAVATCSAATVVNFEQADDLDWDEFAETPAGRAATIILDTATSTLGLEPDRRVVLVGDAADSLAMFADHAGFDLIVVGRTGAGRSRGLLGRVANRLVSNTTAPVLVFGTSERARPTSRSAVPPSLRPSSAGSSQEPHERAV